MNGLDLFSGIGGLSVALRDWVKPVAYCEIDTYCQSILLSRISDGSLINAPIWDDIKTLSYDGRNWPGIDIIYGGFPCQDISIGGYGKGLAGERSGLFYEIVRLCGDIKPGFIFLENVPAITTRGGSEVVREITKMGYDCRWLVISAKEYVSQKRDRWFLLAKSNSQRREERSCKDIQQTGKASLNEESCNYKLPDMECWGAFARSMRKIDGIPYKMDRITALGNSVVPAQAKEAFKILMGMK